MCTLIKHAWLQKVSTNSSCGLWWYFFTSCYKSIRIHLAIVAYYYYEIWQMGVKTTFLNENLMEDIYMTQPEGFIDLKNANKVCKLKRSSYGLK